MLCIFQSFKHCFDNQNQNIHRQLLFQTNREGKPDEKADVCENIQGLLS